MEWLICGSVPDASFPLSWGRWTLAKDGLVPADGGAPLSVQRGTPALLAACLLACEALNMAPPQALLVGDTGDGTGSNKLYQRLSGTLASSGAPELGGLTFHYLFPDVDGHNAVLMALESYAERHPRPLLVADAGFMYVAKMSGYADAYDLFTPDAGELAFLADEKAPHPFYTRGFLLAEDADVAGLVRRAAAHGNCARQLLIKGAVDSIAAGATITDTINEPCVPAMEPIGGTGDLITGLVTALLAGGLPLRRACVVAARTNRIAGELARPTPATQVHELLIHLPEALRRALRTGA